MRIDRRAVLALCVGGVSVVTRSARAAAYPDRLNPDTLGVNTHLAQGDSPLKVANNLSFLGVRHVRDGVPTGEKRGAFLEALVSGTKLTAVAMGLRPLSAIVSDLESLERARPGILDAIEGPNEVNNWPVHFEGATGTEGAVKFQAALYSAVKSSAVLGHLPVISFTDVALTPSKSDVLAFHPYPKQGSRLLTRIDPIKSRIAAAGQNSKPIEFTEFGYSTAEVTEDQQATLLIDGWRTAIENGVKRVFIYQLNDFTQDADPRVPKIINHFGLFDKGGRPKKAAIEIAKLLKS